MPASQGRGISTENKDAASDDVVFPFVAVDADIDPPVGQTFVISVQYSPTYNGNVYLVDGIEKGAIQLERGGQYIFDLSDPSTASHPFALSATENGTHGGGTEYTTGVTVSGTQGTAGASVTFDVPADAPDYLYGYCKSHSGMGFTASILDSGPLRVWSGYGNLTIGSNTYLGVGQLLAFSGLEETLDLRATGFSVILNGIDNHALTIALNANYQNRDITLYMGFNDSDGTLIDTPFILARGRMDVMSIEEGADSSSIVIQCESRLIDFERPRRRLYTDEDQRRDHPTDTGFSLVKGIQDINITWGR